MSRSGNHAVINWLLRHLRGRVCFLNCVEPRQNPFASARPWRPDGDCFYSSYRLDLEAEAKGALSRKDFLLYNYEDCYLSMVADEESEAKHDEWVGDSGDRRDILVLRDPFNLFASRHRSGMYSTRHRGDQPNLVTRRQAGRIWKQHAKEFLAPGRQLKRRPLPINFNLWATDQTYRMLIAQQLELSFTDEGIDAVPATAGGSSFDGRRFNGSAQAMTVLSRWIHYASEPEFWEAFDRQTLDYAERIFGELPPPLASRSATIDGAIAASPLEGVH